MEKQFVVGEAPLDSREGKHVETMDCIVQACKRVFPRALTITVLCSITGYVENTVRSHLKPLLSGGYLRRETRRNTVYYSYVKDMPNIFDTMVEIQTVWDNAIRTVLRRRQ